MLFVVRMWDGTQCVVQHCCIRPCTLDMSSTEKFLSIRFDISYARASSYTCRCCATDHLGRRRPCIYNNSGRPSSCHLQHVRKPSASMNARCCLRVRKYWVARRPPECERGPRVTDAQHGGLGGDVSRHDRCRVDCFLVSDVPVSYAAVLARRLG